MKTTPIIWALGLLLLCSNCSKSYEADTETAEISMAETAAEEEAPISSSAAVDTGKDSTRKFIRTAELKFKVKDVIKSTYAIEDITARQGGFVTYTNLTSTIDNINIATISPDSTLETTHYTIHNTMTVRVPVTRLDSTLKDIAKVIDYLDYRVIKADDVALQVLANTLTQKRVARNEQRLTQAIDNRGRKLEETTNAEELLLQKQEEADNAKIANLSLSDQIKFSTIAIEMYQRQGIKRELIVNEDNIKEYEPPFGTKLVNAVSYGWDLLKNIILFIVDMWGIVLIAGIAWGLIRWFKGRKRKGE